MIDVIIDTLLDTLKLIPFLYIAFLIIEYCEHKLKNKKILKKAGKLGPVAGALLGGVPQCGFAATATSLYTTGFVSLGTLMAIYLATSDEMLPIMLSQNVEISFILKIVFFKIAVGIGIGLLIDALYRNKRKINYDICDNEHCDCEHENTFLAALKHTLNIVIFILIINFILNLVFFLGGEAILSKLFLSNSIGGSFITSLIGLIPNCGASIMITQLYLGNAISLGSLIGGLLTNSGVALILLFKQNKNKKENIMIITLLYLIGSLIGLLVDIFIK